MDKETDPQLHVPEPAIRPGDTPDFSHVEIPRAGEVRRPDPGENPQEMRVTCRSSQSCALTDMFRARLINQT